MSRVLVTGATGFVGRRLLPALRAAGHAVVAATRAPQRLEHADVDVYAVDVADPTSVARLPNGVDVIVHAAVERGAVDNAALTRMMTTNIVGTLNILEYARRAEVGRIVYCSTLSVYALPQPLPIREDGATYPVDAPDAPYGMSKLVGELLCERVRRESGLACFSLRLARIYGPGEAPTTALSQWIGAARAGEEIVVYGGGERSLDFLYVDDAVDALVRAVTAPGDGSVMNVGSGRETTWRVLAETVADVFADGQRPSVRYVEQGTRTRCLLGVARAEQSLGFTARYDLVSGLRHWREETEAVGGKTT